jgi:hypothetical protein
MAKLIYIADDFDSNREAKKINLTISDDLDIYEFKRICQRLASAMGYHPHSIEQAFEYQESYITEEHNVSKILSVISSNATGSKVNT